jgi:hypothetical protein
MRKRILTVCVALLGSTAFTACSGPGSLTSPTPSAPNPLGVQAIVAGVGTGGPSIPGITMSVWAGAPVTASAKLELGFGEDLPTLEIPFEPQSVRIGANQRVTLTTSVPEASDPRLGGRKPTSYRAVLTVRDETGVEKTVFVPMAIPG